MKIKSRLSVQEMGVSSNREHWLSTHEALGSIPKNEKRFSILVAQWKLQSNETTGSTRKKREAVGLSGHANTLNTR